MNELKQRKIAAKAIQDSEKEKELAEYYVRKKAAKEREKRERKCFWTWPWGHIWVYDHGRALWTHKCTICSKTRYIGP